MKLAFDSLYDVQDRGFRTRCWIWHGAGKTGRYGRYSVNGRMEQAHRVAYEWSVGPIPTGLQLDHLCRQTLCVNPDHLEPVSASENVQRGSRAKLTPFQVDRIRQHRIWALEDAGLPVSTRRVPDGNRIRRRLGEMYGVTADQIKHIWRGTSWAS